jgi:hypothetical protein
MTGPISILVRLSSAHETAVLLERSLLHEERRTTQPSQWVDVNSPAQGAAFDEESQKKAASRLGFQEIAKETEQKEIATESDLVRDVEDRKAKTPIADRGVTRRMGPERTRTHTDERVANGTGGLANIESASGQQSANRGQEVAAGAMEWFRAQQECFSSEHCGYFVMVFITCNCVTLMMIAVAMRFLEASRGPQRTVDQSLE